MTLRSLAGAGRSTALPLELGLEDHCQLRVDAWLRILPGHRYVGQGECKGRRVLAKLFVGGKAARHYQREKEGAALLANQGLPTPALLAKGWRDGDGGWLLFAFLEGAHSLWDAWRLVEHDNPLSERQKAVLGGALGLIARMHARGIWQDDLHLDNVLRAEGQLHIVDGGGVKAEVAGQPLSRQRVLENLGVFFAQLPAEMDSFIEELLVHYLQVNSEHALPLESLLGEVARVRRWRMADYLKKVARDCSQFSVRRGASGVLAMRRDEQDVMKQALADPDRLIEQGQLYKNGGTATVARVVVGDRALLIKRYNIKGVGHWLKRFWRPSRAWHSWVEGNRLELLGFATARPLAVRESRWFWLRGRAWLITEFLPGRDIIASFEPYVDGAPPQEQLDALGKLFAALLRERISHGDLKGHNLFWDKGRWALIDLDAMHQHRSAKRFAHAYARDRARFLRNWPADSALYQLLNQRLPAVPGTSIED
ncbi:serine/threonine protein kinase [Stutzerimonas sp. VN223-3]|uniref:lipopolysaccharide kinase InaA family protein n=1 Tax=Stutzerimonas sp. VN223-3 TaxID=3384601 RepID=UPI0038B5B0DD